MTILLLCMIISAVSSGDSGPIVLNAAVWEEDTSPQALSPEYHYESFVVQLTGIAKWDAPGPGIPMGGGAKASEFENYVIAYIDRDDEAAEPMFPEEFTVTNDRGLTASILVRSSSSVANRVEIVLLAWSIPAVYYDTGAGSGPGPKYVLVNNLNLPIDCSNICTQPDCCEGQPLENTADRVSLDNIVYISKTAPNSGGQLPANLNNDNFNPNALNSSVVIEVLKSPYVITLILVCVIIGFCVMGMVINIRKRYHSISTVSNTKQ